MQWKRRLLVRWEYYAENFLGCVQLAVMTVLFRRICDRFTVVLLLLVIPASFD